MNSTFLWVTYTPEEVNEGYWAVYKRLVLPGKMLAVFFIGFLVAQGYVYTTNGLVDYFIDPATVQNMREWQLVGSLLIAGLGIPTVLCMLTWMFFHGRVAHSYESRPNFHFPIVYVLQDSGLSMSFVSGQGTLDWSHVTACVETAKYFCLASTPTDVFVLPKRCLSSDSEVESVRRLLVSKVRTYLRHSGKDLPITYEKVGIELIYIDGMPVVQTIAKPGDEEGKTSQILSGGQSVVAPPPPPVKAGEQVVSGSRSTLSGADGVEQSGITIAIDYKEGEVQSAEKIYFFRKRLPMLSLLYISSLGWILPSALLISYIWGQEELLFEVFQNYGWLMIFALPFFASHALYVYLLTLGRARLSEAHAGDFVFQLTEEGCGVRSGDRYAVLSWWHFEEVWETKDTLMLLFGRKGRAMYVIPKRAFEDRKGQAYAEDLLHRKVAKVLALE